MLTPTHCSPFAPPRPDPTVTVARGILGERKRAEASTARERIHVKARTFKDLSEIETRWRLPEIELKVEVRTIPITRMAEKRAGLHEVTHSHGDLREVGIDMVT